MVKLSIYFSSNCWDTSVNKRDLRILVITLYVLHVSIFILRNHLFRQRLDRIEYYKEECTDVSWSFLLRPLAFAITKTTSWNAKIYIDIKPESN